MEVCIYIYIVEITYVIYFLFLSILTQWKYNRVVWLFYLELVSTIQILSHFPLNKLF